MAILAAASLVITVALTAGLRHAAVLSVPAPGSDFLSSPPTTVAVERWAAGVQEASGSSVTG